MPRWRQCTIMTDGSLGEAVGQDWVAQNFPPAAKESMDKLVAASRNRWATTSIRCPG